MPWDSPTIYVMSNYLIAKQERIVKPGILKRNAQHWIDQAQKNFSNNHSKHQKYREKKWKEKKKQQQVRLIQSQMENY